MEIYKKLLVAHRGASADAHENTIEAFQKAIEFGADMIELDVRKTADGALATIHDDNLDGKKVNELTFAELNQIAGSKGFVVPTLRESLEYISGKLPVQIELKETGYETEVADLALSLLRQQDFYIISFNFSSLVAIKQARPQVRTGLILGSSPKRIWTSRWHKFRWGIIKKNIDMVSIAWQLWERGWAKKFSADMPVCLWTVDDMEVLKKIYHDDNVSMVASNTTRAAIKIIKEQNVSR